MTPATLSPTPLIYEKPIHPTEMPRITTCTELPVDDTSKSTIRVAMEHINISITHMTHRQNSMAHLVVYAAVSIIDAKHS